MNTRRRLPTGDGYGSVRGPTSHGVNTMSRISPFLTRVLAPLLLLPFAAAGAAEPAAAGDKPAEVEKKTVAELLKGTTALPGLFGLHQNKDTGALYLQLKKEQVGKEYIHFVHVLDALPEAGNFRGVHLDTRIYSIERYFSRIEIRAEPTSLYFDSGHPLYRARLANVNRAVLVSTPIEAEDPKTGDIYIKADELFLKEALRQIKPTPNPEAKPGDAFPLGELSADKTRYVAVNNYPANTDVTVEYVYENPAPFRKLDGSFSAAEFAINDDRNISVTARHSFIAMPENDFMPRRDDARVGYFTQVVQDMTSDDAVTPWRDLINRWHLRKKNPGAAVSEPVEPIVWWIENTTPLEHREAIRQATLSWNAAFEKAGFRNAVEVKIQPDDADWDAGDIRYNVLRWTASPNPQFSGYGPSFTNPRTGQILGADIMLEFASLRRYLEVGNIYDSSRLFAGPDRGHRALYQQLAFGLTAAMAMGADAGAQSEIVDDWLRSLVVHEVGHALGLNHNFRASQYRPISQVNDRSAAAHGGNSASVMDYEATNVASPGQPQGFYWSTLPGPYDDWAIDYGYSEALADRAAEAARLDAILARSTEPALAFGNDGDLMADPGAGIDPRVMFYDLSSDAIGYAEQRLKLIRQLETSLVRKLTVPGQSYQRISNAFGVLMTDAGRSAAVVSRYVGGVLVDRALAGQAGGGKPFTPVPAEQQRRAMGVLATQVFAPDALALPAELMTHLQSQRRSFYFYGKTEDPKLHDQAWAVQKAALDHLLNPVVHKRLLDSALYGNEYSLNEMLAALTDAVFAADAKGSVNSRRQNLQQQYVMQMTALALAKPADAASPSPMNQAAVRYELKRIAAMLQSRGNDAASIAHKEYLQFLIKQALEAQRAA